MRDSYWYPEFDGLNLGLFRIGGPGLGNLLFPFARAIVGAKRAGGELIFPTFRQLKIGPLLRGEPDLRTYGDVFRPAAADVVGLHKAGALLRNSRLHRVKGLGNLFADFAKERESVVQGLQSRTTQRLQPLWTGPEKLFTVAVHVRLGDFTRPPSHSDAHARENRTTNTSSPIAWYAQVLARIRSRDPQIRFELHSDGTDDELRSLLQMPCVQRSRSTCAFESILSMSKCRALIASGSTFSAWGAFIGDLPALYFPGQLRHRAFPHRGDMEFECFAEDLTDALLNRILEHE